MAYRSCLEWSSPRSWARALRQPKKWSPLLQANSIPPWPVYKACLHSFALRKLPISRERPSPLDIYGSAGGTYGLCAATLCAMQLYTGGTRPYHTEHQINCARRIRRLELNRLILYETPPTPGARRRSRIGFLASRSPKPPRPITYRIRLGPLPFKSSGFRVWHSRHANIRSSCWISLVAGPSADSSAGGVSLRHRPVISG